ncbi:MAG: hypothetical protein JXR21_01060 [Candidatus Marinimicrobia bacterium]|nr:hypothetical protein [Candidatus Neomarinimicrobiota bacterium]
MKKVIVVAMIALLAVSFAFAQMDVGLRGGLRSGLTGRLASGESNKIEALVTFRSGIIVTGMYQWHKPLQLGEIENLSWFFGGGAHIGISAWWTSAFALGLDAIVGVEYDLETLLSFPLKISLDYKPAFDIIGGWAGSLGDVAFSIRYTF